MERYSSEIQTKNIRKQSVPRLKPEPNWKFEVSWHWRIAAAHRKTSGGGSFLIEEASYFTRANSQP